MEVKCYWSYWVGMAIMLAGILCPYWQFGIPFVFIAWVILRHHAYEFAHEAEHKKWVCDKDLPNT